MNRVYRCAYGAETFGATDDRTRQTMTTTPTATAKLVRTYPRSASNLHHVSVVRNQEPGELAVWTIHRNGNAPIYVALTRADAFRVADFHAGVTA